MPQFKDPLAARGVVLDAQADPSTIRPSHDRDTSDRFVRLTVILAACCFSSHRQRFPIRRVRAAVLIVAAVFLVYSLVLLFTYPWV